MYESEGFVEGIKSKIQQVGGEVVEVIESANIIIAKIPEDKVEIIRQVPGVTLVGKDEPMEEAAWETSEHIIDMGVLDFHRFGNKGDGIKIAIIDGGVDYNHPSIKNNYKGGYDVLTGSTDAMDVDGHGTACAGLAAADESTPPIIGMAPHADIYGIKVGSLSAGFAASRTVKGIAWAVENNMNVISISLGGSSITSVYYDSIFKKAKEKGIVVVAAAGSKGDPYVMSPARCVNAIAVSGIGRRDTIMYSNWGSQVDVCALSNMSVTTKLGGGIRYFYGTSSATPIIAGVMALLRKKYPTKSVNDLAAVMYGMCKDLGEPGKDIYYGHGVPILSTQGVSTFPVTVSSYPRGATVRII